MPESYLIGLDFGSESGRGVLIDVATGRQCAHCLHPYRHGIMTQALLGGPALPAGFALQNAQDYLEAAEALLEAGARVVISDIDASLLQSAKGARSRPSALTSPPVRPCRRSPMVAACRKSCPTSPMLM